MTRTVTAKAVKGLLVKGLSGWEAGKLVLQDMIYAYRAKGSVLTEADIAAMRNAPMETADTRDYNKFIALCQGFREGYMLAGWVCKDACLEISSLDHLLQDADKRRTVELFESIGPHVVTRRQYDEIVAAQRQKKLEYEYSLGYVIEERFCAIAPPEAKKAIDEAGVDIETFEDFVPAVPEQYADLRDQAIDEIHKLHTSGKLPAVYHKEDAKKAKPLLTKWKRGKLSPQDTMKLVDILYVTGQQLYDCAQLPEWKDFVDRYQRHWFDDDERFRHVYAVLEDAPEIWLDETGDYKGPSRPSEWITRSAELILGLVSHDDKPKKSVEQVGSELRDRLDTAGQNVRLFLAIKAVLDAAADAVELDVSDDDGVLASPHRRLGAFIALYNIRLAELKAERKPWESGETRLEKVLRMLPAIDVERLKPSPDSLKQLRGTILNDASGEEWLRTKVRSLQCGDGFRFEELLSQ